ncbi:hypothetical protein PHMEG_00036214 [Phytophthora megakarya]|uniref:Uncharacterized protein n=1 Tax=Phytophthora megakarya TaxID=4795 RepID=A0A225UM18_9STRA|nr:hypothetical protein PHMEG_00036214 [Phytophthora megakarya]
MIGASAEYGHLETVKFFYDLDDGKVETDSWWCDAADPIYYAAEGGHLAVIEWILTNRSPKCTVGILEKAAANNHLDVVKWLHSNRSEGCALWAIAGAARNGHVDMMQWLHVNYPNKFNSWCTGATYGAAEHGHLKAIKWLYEKLREDHACEAIDKAIRTDHIHVADWLQSRFPEFVVGSSVEPHKQLVYVTARANTFETLLYLHVRCAYVFTPSFLQRLRRDLTLFIDDLPLITSWLDEHYPVDI